MAGGKLAQAMRVYADRRMAKILFLGFISGFPWLLIGSMLSLWLKDEGLSRTGIGLFGLVGVVYAINALWAPLVDGLPLPFLSKWLGRRRAWIVAMQGVIVLAMFGLFLLPNVGEGNLWWVALFIFIIATASATQDVAIDATRIEMFGEEEAGKVGAGAAMATSGWWLGFGGGKALAFPFIAAMQAAGVENAWQSGYLSLTIIVALCAAGVVLFSSSPPPRRHLRRRLRLHPLRGRRRWRQVHPPPRRWRGRRIYLLRRWRIFSAVMGCGWRYLCCCSSFSLRLVRRFGADVVGFL